MVGLTQDVTSNYSLDTDKGMAEMEISQKNLKDLTCQPDIQTKIQVEEPPLSPRIEIVDPCLNNATVEATQTKNKETQVIEGDDLRVEIVNDTFHSGEDGESQEAKASLQAQELVNAPDDQENAEEF